MEIDKNYIKKFCFKKTSESLELASEIYNWAEKRMRFPMILYFIKINGTQAIREIFEEVKKENPRDRVAFFIFMVKKNKTIFD